MRKTASEVEKGMLALWLEGDSYRRISRRLDVAIATISEKISDVRKRAPDIDQLRRLNVKLKESGFGSFDGVRACKLLKTLNDLGVSLDEMEDFVQLARKLGSNKKEADALQMNAIKLMQLEKASGKPYQEVVKDFGKKLKESTRVDAKKAHLEKNVQTLEANLKEAERRLAETSRELEKAVSTHKGLAALGVNLLAKLVKFIQEFESLGFDANQLKKLAGTLRMLNRMGLNPAKLESLVAERGTLEAQNKTLRLNNTQIKTAFQKSRALNKEYANRNSSHRKLDQILSTGTVVCHCTCGSPILLHSHVLTQEHYAELIKAGQLLPVQCPKCGSMLLDPREILTQIAFDLIPHSAVE